MVLERSLERQFGVHCCILAGSRHDRSNLRIALRYPGWGQTPQVQLAITSQPPCIQLWQEHISFHTTGER